MNRETLRVTMDGESYNLISITVNFRFQFPFLSERVDSTSVTHGVVALIPRNEFPTHPYPSFVAFIS